MEIDSLAFFLDKTAWYQDGYQADYKSIYPQVYGLNIRISGKKNW